MLAFACAKIFLFTINYSCMKQSQITIQTPGRGYLLVTKSIEQALAQMASHDNGLLHIFLQHSSASLTINENADPTVRQDFKAFEEHLVPRSFPYQHDYEGNDDMPAHIKAVTIGSSLSLPITKGRLALGIWQGVYLGEHRNKAGSRNLIVTLNGQQEE